MKKLLFILLLIILGSCNQPKPQYEKVTLISKKEALGSYYNFMTEKQVMQTEYFLIFSNGKVEQVDIGKFVLAKEGTEFNVRK